MAGKTKKNSKNVKVDQHKLNIGLAQMLKGGVIMDVVTPDQAKLAEDAGACSVMALERVPSDIRAAGGVARMSHVKLIESICKAVSIPVMAKVRIGHFVEAQILESIGVDYIDESEVLTPADEQFHIQKNNFKTPFVCGARNLGEAVRRIHEGAAMIRTKGEAGTGDIVEAVRHMRTINEEIISLNKMSAVKLNKKAKEMRVPIAILKDIRKNKKLPVVNFAAGGIATPADAALMMQLGSEGVFVGSGIFKSSEQYREQLTLAKSIVKAVTNYDKPDILRNVSSKITSTMKGQSADSLVNNEKLSMRGN
ncbi:MAG: pyridoxal 5'-phosphate synthase lyase subunit PdxS [Chloroflexi bacterium]|nr:pyridoxal 5'-phosphate synthase lyase subunit PdxS [Chloroflexota bacterium]|tara:strand:+ start:1138 stop:2064 length:927 start_codon:yes stop_codon:yes gene_type:complete